MAMAIPCRSRSYFKNLQIRLRPDADLDHPLLSREHVGEHENEGKKRRSTTVK